MIVTTKTIVQTTYTCEFCKTSSREEGPNPELSSFYIKAHEKECAYNPKNRACVSCKNLKIFPITCSVGVNGVERKYIKNHQGCECWEGREV